MNDVRRRSRCRFNHRRRAAGRCGQRGVRLAHAVGAATMIAIAAKNSPHCSRGQVHRLGLDGWQLVWSQRDSARCGPILGGQRRRPDGRVGALRDEGAGVMLVHPTPEMDRGFPDYGLGWPVRGLGPTAGRVLLGGRRARRKTILDLPPDHAVPAVRPSSLAGRFRLPRQACRDAVWPRVRGWCSDCSSRWLDDPGSARRHRGPKPPRLCGHGMGTARAQIGLWRSNGLHEAAIRCVCRPRAERAARRTRGID